MTVLKACTPLRNCIQYPSIADSRSLLQEPLTVRPSSQHRHSSSMAGSLPKSRPHSQTLSVGTKNPAHRVTRRKSMSSTAAANINAMAAAVKGISGAPLENSSSSRRQSKPASAFRGPALGTSPFMASSVPSGGSAFGPGSYGAAAKTEAAITDGPPLATMPEHEKGNSKSRARRASEGSRLKGDSKRTSGSELRCEKCGKGYKHSSCLTKHLSVALSTLPSHILSRLKTNALHAHPIDIHRIRPLALLVS